MSVSMIRIVQMNQKNAIINSNASLAETRAYLVQMTLIASLNVMKMEHAVLLAKAEFAKIIQIAQPSQAGA